MGIIKADRGKGVSASPIALLPDNNNDDGDCHYDDRDEEQGYTPSFGTTGAMGLSRHIPDLAGRKHSPMARLCSTPGTSAFSRGGGVA